MAGAVRKAGSLLQSKTFETKTTAQRWARRIEHEIDEGACKKRSRDNRHARRPDRRVVEHLELSGFQIDEGEQVMRKRPGHHGHG
jgi:hypothetical protein